MMTAKLHVSPPDDDVGSLVQGNATSGIKVFWLTPETAWHVFGVLSANSD
jgi:hypothetical protein